MQTQQVDCLLLIMNCEKYRWKANLQKKTWLSKVTKIPFYHVLGNEHLHTDFVFHEEERTLTVKVKDDYNSLPAKVIAAYEAVYKTFQFKYLLKTDDDQVVNTDSPQQLLQVIWNLADKKDSHYGGFVVNVEMPHISKYHQVHPELPKDVIVQRTKYCSGRFYFLSSMAVQDLIRKREMIAKEYFEDYAIGYYLSEELKENILMLETSKFFQDIPNNTTS